MVRRNLRWLGVWERVYLPIIALALIGSGIIGGCRPPALAGLPTPAVPSESHQPGEAPASPTLANSPTLAAPPAGPGCGVPSAPASSPGRPTPRPGEPAIVSPIELIAWQREARDLVLVDLRTQRLCDSWRLPDAVCVPYDELATRLSELPRDKDLVVYGLVTDGHADEMTSAARLLAAKGFPRVYQLEGGLAAYLSVSEALSRPG